MSSINIVASMPGCETKELIKNVPVEYDLDDQFSLKDVCDYLINIGYPI